MSHRSTPELSTLMALRVRGVADEQALAAVAGLALPVVRDQLARFESGGAVRHHAGALAGWGLTSAGRALGERLAADELDATGSRPVVEDAYRGFLELNPRLLHACTAWQVRPGPDGPVVNDHRDPAHDADALAQLEAVHAQVVPLLDGLGRALERFASYAPRLGFALDRVHAGSTDWVDKATIDSFHTVWFELHEDLLATLGRDRASELPDRSDEE